MISIQSNCSDLGFKQKSDLDLHKIDGLHEPGSSSEDAGVQDSPGGGDDLTTTTMDGVGVEFHVIDVEADATHVFVTKNTLKAKQLFLCLI